ncbi:MAG TPA: SRPBCC domain-containing protein [Pseudonocardia sp.]|nr:SRPBCC domain-containing protein [Pseudonocardia sp.]
MKTLETRIDIAAPPLAVWEVLTDLARYAEWNPFVLEASGEVAVGARLHVRIRPEGGRAMTFRPTVTAAEPGRRFAWLGRLWGVPGLFDGAHRFELEPIDGGTRLVHAEDFRGVLVPLVARSLETGSRAGFEAMNLALARRVEALHAARSR